MKYWGVMMFLEKELLENWDKFKEYYENTEFTKFLEQLLPYVNLDRYKYIDYNGEIKSKEINNALFAAYLLNEDKKNIEYLRELYENIHIDKTKKIKKIDRLSNVEKEELGKKFFKTLQKGEGKYALRYGKELLLREKELFYEILLRHSLISDVSVYNGLYAIISKKFIEKIGSRKNYIFPFYTAVYFLSLESAENYVYKTIIENNKVSSDFPYSEKVNYIYENIQDLVENKEKLAESFAHFKDRLKVEKVNTNTEWGMKVSTYTLALGEYIKNDNTKIVPYLLIKAYFILAEKKNFSSNLTVDLSESLRNNLFLILSK